MSETYPKLRKRHRRERAELIQNVLLAAGGNRSEASRRLGMERSFLLRIMKEEGMDIPGGKPGRPARNQK